MPEFLVVTVNQQVGMSEAERSRFFYRFWKYAVDKERPFG